jgi:hypothetical protein
MTLNIMDLNILLYWYGLIMMKNICMMIVMLMALFYTLSELDLYSMDSLNMDSSKNF